MLSQTDVFFLPSKLDSFGMGYLEAMSSGIPVVGLNFQAVPYVVGHDIAGVLCDDDDPETLAAAVVLAYEQKERLGQGGKVTVKQQFDPERLSNKLIKFIKAL